MAKIFFNHVILEGFNVGQNDSSISYPASLEGFDETLLLDSTANSIIYGFKNTFIKDNENIAYYQTQPLTSDKFSIYRKNVNDNIKTFLGVVDTISHGIDDYGIASDQLYQYTVETNPMASTSQPITLQSKEFVSTHWRKWTICDIEYDSEYDIYRPGDTVFSMVNNLNIGTINNNLNIIKYDTLDRYSKVIMNNQKYKSGNISCLIGDFEVKQILNNNDKVIIVEAINDPMDYLQRQIERFDELQKILESMVSVVSNNQTKEEYEQEYRELMAQLEIYKTYILYFPQSNECKYYSFNGVTWQPYNTSYSFNSPHQKIKTWEEFVSNKKNKLLKSPNGDMWVVAICDTTQTNTEWRAVGYPTTISFSWQEVLDVNKISILKW